MRDDTKWRARIRGGVTAYFRHRSSPRFILGLILFLTGLAGWLISYALLHRGMEAMWQRYPLSLVGGYAFFLLLLRIWAEYERAQMDAASPGIRKAAESGDEEALVGELPKADPEPGIGYVDSSGKRSWLDWLDVPDFGEGAGCLIALLIGAVAGLGLLLLSLLSGAPALLAEVFIDAFFAGALYRRLRVAAQEHWLASAVRHTWTYVAGAALLLALIGGCLDLLAPGANSVGPAVRQIVHDQLGI